MLTEPHLNLLEVILAPAAEWQPDARCWCMARVAEGFGYCLHSGLARELKTGETAITSPGSEATIRATQLGELRLEYFRVVPQRLNGIITVLEWRQLERIATGSGPRVFYHAATDAPAQKFARLATLPDHTSLGMRTALLQLWAASVARLLGVPEDTSARNRNLEVSFRRFIGRISEQELATSSMAEMAAQLNCSERHLSRLFRAEFGVSLREKQTELSLQRACQLLLGSNVKIRSIAFDTGYRHVGFFNAVFKKRFGLTPKEWRQRNLPAPEKNGSADESSTRLHADDHCLL